MSPDALFVLLGLGRFSAACLIARQPLTWFRTLAPGLSPSIALELTDI